MTTRTITLLWLSSFLILLVSMIVSLNPNHDHSSTNLFTSFNVNSSLNLNFLQRMIKKSVFEDFIYIIEELARRRSRHHHSHRRKKHKNSCDDSAWKSQLIAAYSVSLVFTVDLKGCANFSSVQKAVDAVPDFSPAKALIIIDSGTYR